MGISLKKGQGVSLKKDGKTLSQVTVGLGWDVAKPKGLLNRLLKKSEDYDLDAICFMLDANGHVADLGSLKDGHPTLVGGDIVFFNSLKHKSGAVRLTGDNRTGAGDGDDEQIIVNLGEMPDRYHRLVFIVSIYEGNKRNQNFGGVENAYIRAVDKSGAELARFDISGSASFSGYHSITFAEVVRSGSEWEFKAIGNPHPTDSLVTHLKHYLPSR